MKNNKINKERKAGILDFVLLANPLVGILAILFSNDEPRNMKIAAIIATFIGLVAAVIYNF